MQFTDIVHTLLYRSPAWTFLYFEIDEVHLMLDTDTFFEYVNARVNYLGDYSEERANKLCSKYFNGQPGTELHISDITGGTPCGDYWFDA